MPPGLFLFFAVSRLHLLLQRTEWEFQICKPTIPRAEVLQKSNMLFQTGSKLNQIFTRMPFEKVFIYLFLCFYLILRAEGFFSPQLKNKQKAFTSKHHCVCIQQALYVHFRYMVSLSFSVIHNEWILMKGI